MAEFLAGLFSFLAAAGVLWWKAWVWVFTADDLVWQIFLGLWYLYIHIYVINLCLGNDPREDYNRDTPLVDQPIPGHDFHTVGMVLRDLDHRMNQNWK